MSPLIQSQRSLLAPAWAGYSNELWRRAKARPSLDLRFADNKSLVDAATGQNLVTFTRASSGTYVDSQGVIRTATTNLLLQSAASNLSPWQRVNATVTPDVPGIIAPDGTQTADFLTENTATSEHYDDQSVAVTAGTTYVYSRFYKSTGAGNRIVWHRVAGASSAGVTFNPDTLSGIGGASFVEYYPGGWIRVSTVFTAASTGNVFLRAQIREGTVSPGTSNYTGNGTSGFYTWGAQLEQSSTVGEYIPTTSTINSAPRFDHSPTTGESLGLLVEESRTNLLLQSNGFDTTWFNSSSSETASAGIAPDGTNTAWELKDTLDTVSTTHSLSQTYGGFTSGTSYSFSVWVKSGTLDYVALLFPAAAFTTGLAARFNLTTGAATGVSAGVTATSVLFNNGWYRCTVTATATSTASGNVLIRTSQTNSSSYIGDGTGTILIWGAQLEAGAFPTSYIPTTTATATRSADVASITGSNFGVSRTNLLLQSEDFATTWTASNLTVTTNSVVAPDGTTTADTIAPPADGLTATRFLRQNPALTTQQAYTLSVFVKIGTATTNGIALYVSDSTATNNFRGNFNLFNLTAGATSTGWATPTSTIIPYPNGWYRCILSGVTSTAHTGLRAQIYLSAFGTVADTYGSMHIWGAQLEVGSTATAYIPTTTAAVTVFESSWYRQDEGAVYVDSATTSNGTAITHAISNGTFNYSIYGNYSSANSYRGANVLDNGAAQATSISTFTGLTVSTGIKDVLSYRVNDFAESLNGLTTKVDTTGTVPTVNQVFIGSNWSGSGNFLNGTIRRLTYFPIRLANEVLQRITQ